MISTIYINQGPAGPAGPQGPAGADGAAGDGAVDNAAVVAAILTDPAAIFLALGVPSYGTLAEANAALTIGATFYNSTSGKLEIATE